RLLIIQPWDRSIVGNVQKAIQKSDLGLNPISDGEIIRLVIPPPTEERRKELVKVVHKRVEDAKIAVRNVRRDALEELRKLEKDKKIELLEPYFVGNFTSYLKSVNAIGLWFVLAVTGITIASIYAIPSIEQFSLVRIIIGGIFVLFVPGYALISMLFSKHDTVERIALSIGVSLAIVPLIGLILNYTPLGIRLDPVVTILSIFSTSVIFIAIYNQYKRCKNT
ncbi:MAG: ribosome recycling factor, partial [Candidatus Nitrosocaldaceae archaeon]